MFQCEKNFEILDHSLRSFLQESKQGKISKWNPTKATLVKKHLLEGSDPQIGSNVIAFDKNKQRKVFSENFRIRAREASNIWEGT